MKKIVCSIAFLFFLAVLLYSCSQGAKETQNAEATTTSAEKTADSVKSTVIDDPNQPSELAALMREMFTDTEGIKKAVQAKASPEDWREKFSKIYAAKPTETDMKEGAYPAMAKIFLESMNSLYDKNQVNNQIQNYNLMIGACLACHQNQCPGPMTRIKKLLIN
jgi:hypothetical protein